MDNEERSGVSPIERFAPIKTAKKRRKTFINEQLHQIIHINIPADIITTFNYAQDKIIRYPYRSTKKIMKKAYSIGEAARVIDRHPDRIRFGISNGHIQDGQKSGPNGKKYFTEDQIMDMQDYFANIHSGRPRKDGSITAKKNSVTKEEASARLGVRQVLYIQNEKGDFIPVWRSVEF
jgi:hypothetical protein